MVLVAALWCDQVRTGAPSTPCVGRSVARSALPLVEGFLEPGPDGRERRTGGEDGGYALFLQDGDVGVRDDPSHHDEDIVAAFGPESLDDPRYEGQVGAREQRQSDGIGILLEHGLDDLIGSLMESGVDDLEPGITQCPGNDLGPTIMPVEAGLGDNHAVGALHGVRV